MLARLFQALAAYRPTLVGTLPLGLQLAGSDLDVICQADDLDAFERALAPFGVGRRVGDASVTNLVISGLPVEVFAQATPVEQQLGFRHMIIEGRLLTLFGEPLRTRVLELKRAGLKTEPAFAQLLGLEGDPFQALLTLELLGADQLRARFAGRLPER